MVVLSVLGENLVYQWKTEFGVKQQNVMCMELKQWSKVKKSVGNSGRKRKHTELINFKQNKSSASMTMIAPYQLRKIDSKF